VSELLCPTCGSVLRPGQVSRHALEVANLREERDEWERKAKHHHEQERILYERIEANTELAEELEAKADQAEICDHNLIPCRKWFRAGWVCVRCDRWFGRAPSTLPF
jgi:predicted RNase H-like nuclease (RuvC/YqgF family)